MINIFVGNLDFDCEEEQLLAAFDAHGAVETVTIVLDRDTGQPRGFAFVEMSNSQQAEKRNSFLGRHAFEGAPTESE